MEDLDILIPKKIKIVVGERTVEIPPLNIKKYVEFMRVFNDYIERMVKGEDLSQYIVEGTEIAAKAVAIAIGEDEKKIMNELYPIQAVNGIKKILEQNQIESTLKNTVAMVIPENMPKVVPSQAHSSSSPKNMAGHQKKSKK